MKEKKGTPGEYVPEYLGSAPLVNLDGRSEDESFLTGDAAENREREKTNEIYPSRGAPWGAGPSLEEKTKEVGIDFDRFVEALEFSKSDQELAEDFGVPEKTIYHLRRHFERFGIDSTIGQD